MLKKNILEGMLSGLMISIGGSVFLACDNRYIGAVLFTVALLTICMFGFSLYTGKIGFVVNDTSKTNVQAVFSGLLGNFIATLIFGLLIWAALPNLHEAAAKACETRLMQSLLQTLLRSVFCGVLMYVAVWIYREKKSVVGILFCVPTFIIAGFEHSIADMFYFSLAGFFSFSSLLFIILVVLGNTLGGMIIPLVQKLVNKK